VAAKRVTHAGSEHDAVRRTEFSAHNNGADIRSHHEAELHAEPRTFVGPLSKPVDTAHA
jgi:hypothetical protein